MDLQKIADRLEQIERGIYQGRGREGNYVQIIGDRAYETLRELRRDIDQQIVRDMCRP